MGNINRVMLSGNLTRSPELKTTPGGMAVLQMGIAVNGRRKNSQTGQWEDVPNYFDLVMFGTRAEKVSQYLDKGSKVCIEGELRWRQWTDQQSGQKRSKVEVLVSEIEFTRSNSQNYGQVSAHDLSDEPIPF